MAKPYRMSSYVAGAKAALNYRGFDDYMVYYTLLAMGISPSAIKHIGKSEREKRGELAGLRRLRGFTMPDMHTFPPILPL